MLFLMGLPWHCCNRARQANWNEVLWLKRMFHADVIKSDVDFVPVYQIAEGSTFDQIVLSNR